MKAPSRFGLATLATALALVGQPALGQDNHTTNASAEERVGPSELESFTLNGTVTRPAEPQPTPSNPTTEEPGSAASSVEAAPSRTTTQPSPRPREATAPAAPSSRAQPTPLVSGQAGGAAAPAAASLPLPEPAFSRPVPQPALAVTDKEGPGLLPWLLALLVAAAGAAYLLWRRRAQPMLQPAGGPGLAFTAPEAEPARPAPSPAPVPAPPPAPAAPTIVSTRLRPWIDIEFAPTRCIVDADRATIEFEVGMVNSGSAPAHDVLLEVGIFNAGPEQDEQIALFQAKPTGDGPRVALIEPLRSVHKASRIAVAIDKLKMFDAGGRRFFVPMMVLTATYRWPSGEGRTSHSYLIGRERPGADKMSPFRLDLGPRLFRGLGAREHHLKIRV